MRPAAPADHDLGTNGRAALLIPLKRFEGAKERLSSGISPQARHDLAQQMATAVISAAGGLSVWVACDDPGVSAWSIGQNANVVWRGGGLNRAVQASLSFLFAEGFDRVVVAHGDLPHATTFSTVLNATSAMPDAVALVTDRHGDGTNVLSLPSGTGFRVQYGKGSYELHRAEAQRLGLRAVTVEDPRLALDIDHMEDLEIMRKGSE